MHSNKYCFACRPLTICGQLHDIHLHALDSLDRHATIFLMAGASTHLAVAETHLSPLVHHRPKSSRTLYWQRTTTLLLGKIFSSAMQELPLEYRPRQSEEVHNGSLDAGVTPGAAGRLAKTMFTAELTIGVEDISQLMFAESLRTIQCCLVSSFRIWWLSSSIIPLNLPS